MSPDCATPSPKPPSRISPVESLSRCPFVVMFVPWNTLLAFAEKPRPKPPASPARNAWVASEPSGDTHVPRTPVLPPQAQKPFTPNPTQRHIGRGRAIVSH